MYSRRCASIGQSPPTGPDTAGRMALSALQRNHDRRAIMTDDIAIDPPDIADDVSPKRTRCRLGDDFPSRQDDHLIGRAQGKIDVMHRHENTDAMLARQAPDDLQNAKLVIEIE